MRLAFSGLFRFCPFDGGRLEFRCLRWLAEPGFQIGNPPLSHLKAFPKRPDQGVLLGVVQVAEIRKLGHPRLESNRP
jgi:hypothetical protein